MVQMLRQCQQMAPHLSLTPAAVEMWLVSDSSYSMEPPSSPTTSWLHPSTKLPKKVTESVWSCCCPVEPRLILRCQMLGPRCMSPAGPRQRSVWSCCCVQVRMLALDVGRSALCTLQFVLEKQTFNFSWTLGQTKAAGMQRGKLLSICRHQTAPFDLLCRGVVWNDPLVFINSLRIKLKHGFLSRCFSSLLSV